ncbi:PE domain-containing protein [Actinomycetospora sp. CA-101289]|uniref:PE domain-containing protein n=1 Tax=Actinomycetospora sp. CA-101289 TaxID=3239893 RepID=UPI003D9663F2
MSAPGGLDGIGGGMFEVNIAEAPQAIKELEQARSELESVKAEAVRLGQVNPPAADNVSLEAAEILGQAAVEGPRSFLQALTEGVAEIDRLVASLRAGFELYRESDQRSAFGYEGRG